MKSFDPITCRLEYGISDYFSGLRSSHALEWELYQAVGRSLQRRSESFAEITAAMPLRAELLRSVPNPLTDGNGRAATVALSVVLAYEGDHGLQVLLRRRGRRSITYDRGRWHVLPSGMLQAPYREYGIEYSPVHAAMWEFLEELFDVPDPSAPGGEPTWFYSSQEPVRELREMLASDQATLYLTGVTFNLMNLRPEICMLLHIRDRSWFRRHADGENGATPFKANAEFADAGVSASEVVMKARWSRPEEFFEANGIQPESIVPAGAGSLYLGLSALDRVRSWAA